MIFSAESGSQFVDLDVSVAAWIALLAVIVAMLAIDLYRHREAHAPTPKEAAIESIIWVMCGLALRRGHRRRVRQRARSASTSAAT